MPKNSTKTDTNDRGRFSAKRGNRFEALEPLGQGFREHFGGSEAKVD